MSNKPLILNQTRNLGDVISDGFIFVKRNFKVIGELFLIGVLPLLILGIYNIYFIFKDINLFEPDPANPFGIFTGFKFIVGYGFTLIGILFFYYVNFATAICYVNNSNSTPERHMVLDFMKRNAGRFGLYFLALIVLFLLLGGLLGVLAFTAPFLVFILFIPLFFFLIYLFPYLSVLPMTFIEKKLSFVDAISETFRLIKGEWWPTFGTILITNIIGSFASYILIIPIYIIMMVQMFSSADASGIEAAGGFWMSILMIVSIISSTLILTYTISCVAIKYFDLKERKDFSTLRDRIENIGKDDSAFFENEGDF